MKAWLITNSFLKTEKFSEIYSELCFSANKKGIHLQAVNYSDILESHSLPSFALMWDKDFYIAELLEKKGLRIFNCVSAGKICDDKAETYLCLSEKKIPVPETYIAPKTYPGVPVNDWSFLHFAIERLGYPFVIKEVCGSFGNQVYLAENEKQAKDIILSIHPGSFIMQKYISECSGRDIRINVVGGKFISAIKRTNKNDFRSNITAGGTAEQYQPTDKEISLAVAAVTAVGCDFAGVDIFPSGLVCEVNSSPHFISSDKICTSSFADGIFDYIQEVSPH